MEKAFRRNRLGVRLAVGLLLLPLAFRAAHADSTAPTTDTDFDVVQVDLNGQFFNRVLPFDVPFIIAGTAPAGVNSLRVRCRILDPKSGKPTGDCWPGGPAVWRNNTDPGTTSLQFRVLVPRLPAESYFQFDFGFEKKISTEEAQAVATKVAAAFDPVLWGTNSSSTDLPLRGDLTTDEVKALRQQLMAALQEVTGITDVPTPGSVFNSETPFEDVRRDFKQTLRPVRDAQGGIHDAVATYQGELPQLNDDLRKLRTHPQLGHLRDLLKSPSAPAGAQAHADMIDAARSVDDAPLLLQGDPALASADTLAAFLEANGAYFADAKGKVKALRNLLGSNLTTPEGTPQPFLTADGKIAPEEVSSLAALSENTALVGRIDRALDRIAGELTGDAGVQGALDQRSAALAAMVREYRRRVENVTGVAASTVGNFQTQSNNYISADTGFSCSPELSACSTYVGANFYFHPVNKAAPLRQFGPFFSRESLKRRLALMLGLTVQGIADDKTRDDLFGSQSLLIGLGARITNSVRFTAGSLVFQKLSPNPLSTDKKLTTTYFFSLSFDVDVVPALKGFGKLFTP